MRYFIDLQGNQTGGSRNRGIGNYTNDLAKAIARRMHCDEDLFLAHNSNLENPIPNGVLGTKNINEYEYATIKTNEMPVKNLAQKSFLNDLLFKNAIAITNSKHILFSSIMEIEEQDFYLPPSLNFGPLFKTYAILYDIIPYIYAQHYLAAPQQKSKYYKHLRVLKSADIIFAISEHTKMDAIKHLGIAEDRIVTIGGGIDLQKFKDRPTTKREFVKAFGIKKDFLFFLGGGEFRKNLVGLIEAYGMVPLEKRQGKQLLISGKLDNHQRKDCDAIIKKYNIEPEEIIFAGYMKHSDLLGAYNYCKATVIPSLYEGFGLPVLEAMACKAPVIISNNSSLSEILPYKDLQFDPRNPKSIRDKIVEILDKPEIAEKYIPDYDKILKHNSWDNCADIVLNTFRKNNNENDTYKEMRDIAYKRNIKIMYFGKPDSKHRNILNDLAENCNLEVYSQYKFIDNTIEWPFNPNLIEALNQFQLSTNNYIVIANDLEELENFIEASIIGHSILLTNQSDEILKEINAKIMNIFPHQFELGDYQNERLDILKAYCNLQDSNPYELAKMAKEILAQNKRNKNLEKSVAKAFAFNRASAAKTNKPSL